MQPSIDKLVPSLVFTGLQPANDLRFKPLKPIDRVRRLRTRSERLIAASVEIEALTTICKTMADAIETLANAQTDKEIRASLLGIVARARGVIS